MSAAQPRSPHLPRDKKKPKSVVILAPENWPEGPSKEAYHGIMGAVVRCVEPHTEADPHAILLQGLVGFGNLIGRRAHFMVEAREMYLNEFLVLVGKSGRSRKGTSWARALQVLEPSDPQWARERRQMGLSSSEGLITAVRDSNGENDKGVEDKRLMVEEEEFVGVLRQSQRQGNTLSAMLRTAWDKGSLQTLTRKSERATGAHVSIIGHITAEELKESLTKTEQANGFGNRFLWIVTRRCRILSDGSENPPELNNYIERIRAAAEFARSVDRMQRSPEAQALWHEIYLQLANDEAGIVGTLLGRGEAHITRLSCLYALMDSSRIVQPVHLKAALALWEYTERCVRYIFGRRVGTPIADTIIAALQKTPEGLTRKDIGTLFNRHQSAERIDEVLAMLAHQRLAITERIATKGRPREVWRVAVGEASPNAPAELGAAIRRMVEEFDDSSVNRLWQQVRAKAADATAGEVEHAVALHMPRIRKGSIHSPVPFLMSVVPAWFEGNTLAEYRAGQAQLAAASSNEPEAAFVPFEDQRAMYLKRIPELEAALLTESDANARQLIERNLDDAWTWLQNSPKVGGEEEGIDR